MEKSCGILMYRRKGGRLQVLLGKDGGPFTRRNPWNIPKGHMEEGEDEWKCAVREFEEETGLKVPQMQPAFRLGESKTTKGKKVVIFAMEHDYSPDGDAVEIHSNLYSLEYPRHSGKFITAPELKEAKYIDAEQALGMMFEYQRVFVENLLKSMK